MVVQGEDKIGVARDHRWVRLAEQKRRLEVEGCRSVIDIGGDHRGGYDLDDLLKLACDDRTFVLVHAFLLADPRMRRKRGGMKAHLAAVVDEITKRGATVKDMETGLTTATKEHRKAILAVAFNHISRSNRGLQSALNGTRSPGRPKVWTDPAVRKVLWDEWHSSEHKTNADAIAAAAAKLNRNVYMGTMYRVVREMRREKGLPEAGGASGRLPGNPKMREHPRRKKRRVYFVRCGRRVKIGVATNVPSRVGSMQTGSAHEIELLTCIPGDDKLEAKLHQRFHHLHIKGEWFRYKDDLVEYVQSLPKRTR